MLRTCRMVVAITEESICYGVPSHTLVELLWVEVSSLKECHFRQRLLIANRTGDRKINLEYQLENFGDLLAVVLKKTRNRQDESPIRTRFHSSRAASGLIVGLAVAGKLLGPDQVLPLAQGMF